METPFGNVTNDVSDTAVSETTLLSGISDSSTELSGKVSLHPEHNTDSINKMNDNFFFNPITNFQCNIIICRQLIH